MTTFKGLRDYRRRAFNLLLCKLPEDVITPIDYEVDTWLRKLLKLPDRPEEAKPYVGWMMPSKNSEISSKKTSKRGIDMIKRHEGLRTNAYICPGGVLTIGYGHTKTVYPQMSITPLQAEELLKQDLQRFENSVNKHVKVPISQGQFDALVSFSFNVGTGAFKGSTLLELLNQGKYREAGAQFSRWTLAGGSRLPEYITRFDSQHEFKVYLELCRMYGHERIKNQYATAILPPSDCFPRGKSWKVDFAITDSRNPKDNCVYVEAKGMIAREFSYTMACLELNRPEIFYHLWLVFPDSIPTNNALVRHLAKTDFSKRMLTLQELKTRTKF